jgi:hypothetical protein
MSKKIEGYVIDEDTTELVVPKGATIFNTTTHGHRKFKVWALINPEETDIEALAIGVYETGVEIVEVPDNLSKHLGSFKCPTNPGQMVHIFIEKSLLEVLGHNPF